MILNRRHFLKTSAAAAASAIIPHRLWASTNGSGSKKKGLGLAEGSAFWPGMLTELRCRWVYTWTGTIPPDLPDGVAFIPMIRSKNAQPERIANVAENAKQHGITELLGLNEPDAKRQDDMSVEEALDLWPLLMETGLRLGSPGCVHPDRDWMIDFMAGVKERDLRVDFISVHSYGGPEAKPLIRRLEKVHDMFGLPLWITELGVGDWRASSVEENQHPPETVLIFMQEVLPMLEELEFLERYAWFPALPSNPALGTSALFDESGTLTPLGEFYRDA